MFRLIGLVLSIGLADSINPSTIAPALYLASGKRPRRRVAEFTLAVFLVYLAGGALIALGPGQLLRSALPHPHRTVRSIGEMVAGAMLIGAAGFLLRNRARLAARGLSQANPRRRSSALLGATITVVELPTAFPYFAAIAAIVGSGFGLARETMLLMLFNVCFVLPLLGILATLTFARDRSHRLLASSRRFLEQHWPQILGGLMMIVGAVALLLGVTGLASAGHGRVGRTARHLPRVLHH